MIHLEVKSLKQTVLSSLGWGELYLCLSFFFFFNLYFHILSLFLWLLDSSFLFIYVLELIVTFFSLKPQMNENNSSNSYCPQAHSVGILPCIINNYLT